MFASDRVRKKHLTFLIGASDQLYQQGFSECYLEVLIYTTSQNASKAKTRNESLKIPYSSAHTHSSKRLRRERKYLLMVCLKIFSHKICSWLKQTRVVFMHCVSLYLALGWRIPLWYAELMTTILFDKNLMIFYRAYMNI